MNSILKKLWNTVLIAITVLAAFGFLLGACALDSDSWTPFIACIVCGAWLVVFALANGGLEQ